MKINFSWNISESIASLYSIPIPLLEIAKDESLSVIYDNYGKDTFDGMTWYEPRQNRFFIHINTERGNTENSLKGRFTLAHELGHYFIDHHRNAMIHGLMKPHIHRFEPFGKNENWEIEREADDDKEIDIHQQQLRFALPVDFPVSEPDYDSQEQPDSRE